MEKSVTCSKNEKESIDILMKPVEDIMRNPSNYENAQNNVKETIDKLFEYYPQSSLYIQEKYGKLCAKYGLDWYTDQNKDNAMT